MQQETSAGGFHTKSTFKQTQKVFKAATMISRKQHHLSSLLQGDPQANTGAAHPSHLQVDEDMDSEPQKSEYSFQQKHDYIVSFGS